MIRDSNSWTVFLSSDYEINFLIFVACSFGLIEVEDKFMNDWVSKKINLNDSIKQNLKEQWNDYWNSSLAKKAAVLNPDNYYSIGAPHFEKIEYFELREACSRVWDSFINWWYMPAGGQAAMTRWEEKVDIFFKKGT